MKLAAEFALGEFAFGAAVGNGQFVVATELLVGSEVAGHEKVHDGPDVGDAVFDGGAGEDEFAVGLDLFGGFGVTGGVILDVLGLVEDDGGEVVLVVVVDVAAQEGIGGEDEVGGLNLIPEGMALGAAEGKGFELGGEAVGFLDPVLHEAGGTDDEGGGFAVGFATSLELQPCEGLQGFAEPHLVGEEAAELVLFKEAQPIDAFALVGAQDFVEVLGDGDVLDFHLAVGLASMLPPGGGVFDINAVEVVE